MPADVALGVRWSASDRVADALIRGTRLVGALGICAANTLSRSTDAILLRGLIGLLSQLM